MKPYMEQIVDVFLEEFEQSYPRAMLALRNTASLTELMEDNVMTLEAPL